MIVIHSEKWRARFCQEGVKVIHLKTEPENVMGRLGFMLNFHYDSLIFKEL